MRRSSRMHRTFWPATSFSDLPDAVEIEQRLKTWVTDWYGDGACISKLEIVSTPDVSDAYRFESSDAMLAAMQINQSFAWQLLNIPTILTTFLGLITKNEKKVAQDLAVKALLPIPQRPSLENYTFATSHLFDIPRKMFPLTVKHVESISTYAATQTILITCLKLHGKFSFTVAASHHLFNEKEVLTLIDDVVSKLLKPLR